MMFKVRVKGEGVKLANKWCFIGDEVIIDEEEYEKNKEYVDVIEVIEETKAGGNPNSEEDDTGVGDNSEDEELEALREKAKELGIKNIHNMKKETLIAKIQEIEEKAGENLNPEGE